MKNKKRHLPSSTYHLYLGIDSSFSKKVSELSKKLFRDYKTNFIIGETYVPHFTLYLFAAPLRNEKELILMSEKLSKKIKTSKLHAGRLICSYDNWLMISIRESELIKKLQEETLVLFNSLRQGILRKKYRNAKEIVKLPEVERENLRNYGDRHVKKNYDPHISISEFEDIKEAQTAFKNYKDYFLGTEIKITSLELVKEMHGDASARGKILYKKDYE